MTTCKNCGEELLKNPWGAFFCSVFCADMYEQGGGNEVLLHTPDENTVRAKVGTTTFAVICIRCEKIVGYIPGLLEVLGEGRPLDDLKRQHLNCHRKEATS